MSNRMVFVSGCFNVLHPGHLRLLRFAKECGDRLVVAVEPDMAYARRGNESQNAVNHAKSGAKDWDERQLLPAHALSRHSLERRVDGDRLE